MSGRTHACRNFSGQPKFRKAAQAKTMAILLPDYWEFGAPWEKILLVIYRLRNLEKGGTASYWGKEEKNPVAG